MYPGGRACLAHTGSLIPLWLLLLSFSLASELASDWLFLLHVAVLYFGDSHGGVLRPFPRFWLSA
jgi:hypothetical protein